jgi:hypothetical protein
MPGAVRLKETAITWKHLVVLTAESPNRNLLRGRVMRRQRHGDAVFVRDEVRIPAAAADLEHQKIVRQLTTGTMSKERGKKWKELKR